MNQQREIMYEKRNEILDSESIHQTILESIHNHIVDLVKSHIAPEGYLTENDKSEILEAVNENLLKKDIDRSIFQENDDDTIEKIYEAVLKEYEDKIEEVPQEVQDEFEKALSLQVIDNYWMEHINTMSHLREGIYLRSYAQEDPLRAYTVEGFDMFDQMLQKIDRDLTIFLLRAEIHLNVERKEVAKKKLTNEDTSEVKQQPKRVKKIGRNDPCPCGSGRKYKNCCGK